MNNNKYNRDSSHPLKMGVPSLANLIDFHSIDVLWGLSKKRVLEICREVGFPGSNKWPKEHPIWDCSVDKALTPRDAWENDALLMKAIDNLFWICHKSIHENKYLDFLAKHKASFESLDKETIAKQVLVRFTMAKIAPKVTALQESRMLAILDESGVDLSCGCYCPMAGFGGIIRGCERWLKQHKIGPTGKIEAFDINPFFCQWYGWGQRDVLAQVVETDKICIACPPFGEHTERWKGTPSNMYYECTEWADLIREHVKAPNYIFIGPETTDNANRYASGKKPSGLFAKKYGIQWMKEYTIVQ